MEKFNELTLRPGKHLVWKENEKDQIINDDIYFLFYLLFYFILLSTRTVRKVDRYFAA